MAEKKSEDKNFESRLMWKPGEFEVTPPPKKEEATTSHVDRLKRKVAPSDG